MFFLFFLLKHTNLETSPLWCHIDSWYIANICIWKTCGNFQAKKKQQKKLQILIIILPQTVGKINIYNNSNNIAAPWKVAPLGSRMKNDDPETKYSKYINLRWLFFLYNLFCLSLYLLKHFKFNGMLSFTFWNCLVFRAQLQCISLRCRLIQEVFRKIWLDPFLGSSYFNLYFYCIFYAYHSLYCSEVLYQSLWSC